MAVMSYYGYQFSLLVEFDGFPVGRFRDETSPAQQLQTLERERTLTGKSLTSTDCFCIYFLYLPDVRMMNETVGLGMSYVESGWLIHHIYTRNVHNLDVRY